MTGSGARSIIVTGAAQGIGQAIAAALDRRFPGSRLYLADIDKERVTAFAAGLGATPVVLDLGDEAAIASLARRIDAEHGGLDILVHSAGGVRGQVGRPVEEVPLEDWQAIQAVNVTALFLLAKHLAPGMKARAAAGEAGRIVSISSGAGLRPSLTGIQAYTAAKHALVGLTKQLAQELGPHGITVNSVAPGFVRSNPATERQWQSYGPEGQKRLVEGIFLKRLGTPDDIAAAVAFFAAPEAVWITGQVLSVDGGRA